MKSSFNIDIDILGACNLRCPSCPQGNVKDYRLPQGFIEPGLLEKIVAKARSECPEVKISLYNWAEPFLHPRLPELIRIVQDAGIPCGLSSNLNILPNVDALMDANPDHLRISNSGFSQEVYGRTHRGGNIEKVKKHMKELAEAKKRRHASTRIYVYYHRYRHNLHEELLMRDFATSLGFYFCGVWALFFPLEKILSAVGQEAGDFPLTEEDQELLASLALPMQTALAAGRKYCNDPCRLQEDEISLDFQGNFTLCCGVFNAGKYTLGNYLDMPLDEIQRLRQRHPLCGICTQHGAHAYLTYGIKEMDELALANIASEEVDLSELRRAIASAYRQERLAKFYHQYISGVLSPRQRAALSDLLLRMQRFSFRLHHRKN